MALGGAYIYEYRYIIIWWNQQTRILFQVANAIPARGTRAIATEREKNRDDAKIGDAKKRALAEVRAGAATVTK